MLRPLLRRKADGKGSPGCQVTGHPQRFPSGAPYTRGHVKGRNGHFTLHEIIAWAWPVIPASNDPARIDAVELQFRSNRPGKEAPCSALLGTDEAEALAHQILQAVAANREPLALPTRET